MQRILVIQTAFIGDVVLATGLLEDLHLQFPHAQLDILVRKGNESLFDGHPFLNQVLIWQKKEKKYPNLFKLIQQIRQKKYDQVINVQRYAATGFITILSGALETIGFDKNPFSIFFTKRVKHIFSKGDISLHEVERNFQLIENKQHQKASNPRLYPSDAHRNAIEKYIQEPYICMAPASVWFTKQFPVIKWIELIKEIPEHYRIYLLGAPSDNALCQEIAAALPTASCTILAGQLNFLESAALMEKAVLNYVNDSAPMHFASAVNAPVTAIYCSTIPAFGYGPLSSNSNVVETKEILKCRPCGIHGHKACPETHFDCALKITNEQLLNSLPKN